MRFNIKLGSLELRSCGEHLFIDAKIHDRAEIVQWEGRTCYTIAYWEEDSDGFDLHFVGHRPFDIETPTFMRLAQLGQHILEVIGKEDEDEKGKTP